MRILYLIFKNGYFIQRNLKLYCDCTDLLLYKSFCISKLSLFDVNFWFFVNFNIYFNQYLGNSLRQHSDVKILYTSVYPISFQTVKPILRYINLSEEVSRFYVQVLYLQNSRRYVKSS